MTVALVAIGIGLALAPAVEARVTNASGGTTGYDVSYPQCGKTLPSSPAFGIVGVNNGILYSANPCLGTELRWAQQAANRSPAFYANTGDPGPAYSSHWPTRQATPQLCDPAANNSTACSYDYGWNGAKDSFADAVAAEQQVNSTSAQTATVVAAQAPWWLDIETANSWQTLESAYGQTPTSQANDVASLDGAIAYLQSVGVSRVGLYSTSYQWGQITGGTGSHFASNPDWVAGYSSQSSASAGCTSAGFAGGPVQLTQYPLNGFDADQVCSSPTPDFSLSASPSSQSVVPGSPTSYTVTVTRTGGFTAPVTLSTSGLPSGATASFTPNPETGTGSTLTLGTASSTPTGTYPVTVTGTAGSVTHSTTVTLTITAPPPPDFSISANPTSVSVVQGSSGTSTISTAVVSPPAQSVSLSSSSLPAGATATFNPTSVTAGGSSTLTLGTAGTTPTGSFPITVTGTAGSVTHSTAVTLTITASPPAGGGIVNGGFEAGSLAGWTSTGSASVSTTPHTGSYSAQVGSTSPGGSSSLAQTFTAPAGTSQLRFWYQVHCPDTVTYDWASATLMDNTSATTTTVLPNTCTNNNTWVQATASITAGHSYTLTLSNHDDNYPGDPTYTLYDDVLVQ